MLSILFQLLDDRRRVGEIVTSHVHQNKRTQIVKDPNRDRVGIFWEIWKRSERVLFCVYVR